MPAHRLWMKSGASGRAINLDHPAVNDNENADGQRPHGNADEKGLEPQAEQWAEIHRHKLCFEIGDDGADVYGGICNNNAGGAVDNTLRHVKHAHYNIPCVCHDKNGAGSFENPLEEHPCVYIVEVVFLCNELNQLQRHHKCKICKNNMSECVGKEKPVEPPAEPENPTDEPDSEKSGSNPALLVLLLAVLGGGGALYYFKFKKAKPDTKGPVDLDDYDYGDDDEDDFEAEEVPEDDTESEDGDV